MYSKSVAEKVYSTSVALDLVLYGMRTNNDRVYKQCLGLIARAEGCANKKQRRMSF